jgi:hypothetical protein
VHVWTEKWSNLDMLIIGMMKTSNTLDINGPEIFSKRFVCEKSREEKVGVLRKTICNYNRRHKTICDANKKQKLA